MKDTGKHLEWLDDPDWLLHQFDPVGDRILWVKINREVYRQSLFLDERMAAQQPPSQITPLWPVAEALAAASARPCHAIFHVSHCGSTLLSRLLQACLPVLAPREPIALKALAAFRRDLGSPLAVMDPARYPAVQSAVFAALERRYEDDRGVLIKGTSDTTNLAADLLDRHPENRLVLMTMHLEPFLATMLRSDLRREETQQMAAARLADLHRRLGDDTVRLYHLQPGEAAAMNWLANMAHFARLQGQAAERCRLVDFEVMLGDMPTTMESVIGHLGWPLDPEAVAAALQGPILRGYSKDPGMRYGPDQRAQELDRCRRQFAAEIAAGLGWARRLIDRHEQLQTLAAWL